MGYLELAVLAGGFAGGLVNGLTGFGTGLAAMNIWLQVITPLVASPLVVVCSLVGQLQTLPKIWHAIIWPRVVPFIVGGLIGVPIGTWLLPMVPAQTFKAMIGGFLVVYCTFMLASRRTYRVEAGGRVADGFVGVLGGVMGGLSGISGAIPSLWSGLRGWGKDERRGVFQAFNVAVLAVAFASQAMSGYMTLEVARMAMFALPGTILGVWIGRKIYDRLGQTGFDRIVMIVLLISGLATVATTIISE